MWTVARRLLAVLGLVISLVGFAAFAGAAAGIWRVKAETNRRTDALTGKAHEAMDAADHTVGFVRGVIEEGRTDVRTARKDAAKQPRQPVNPFLQLTARQASETLVGSVERADAAVVIASDAAVIAKAALEMFGDDRQLPELKQWLGVKPEELARTKAELGNATAELRQVRSVLGVPVGDADPTPEQLAVVETALDHARDLTDRMGEMVANARTQVDETKRAVDLWVLRVALAVTAVGAVGAAGQFFMARFCWRVLRGKPA